MMIGGPVLAWLRCEGAMFLLVLGARLLSLRMTVKELVEGSNRFAAALPARRLPEPKLASTLETCKKAAYRSSKGVPGAACLHRAVASQVWLALAGVSSEVMIGFRKRAKLEGHAWLEVDTVSGRVLLFASDEDGYSRTWKASL
jgi:hypothetical protein